MSSAAAGSGAAALRSLAALRSFIFGNTIPGEIGASALKKLKG